MITLTVLFLATLFLAYSNGANDNFKGVATLFGSGTTSYKSAITWATISTFAGSITSLFLAETLLKNFSGRGVVPNELAASPQFVLAVGLAAGLTVMLATIIGFPISTTHGLVGALVGAGLTAVGTNVNFGTLGSLFFLPLLVSPLVAVGLGVVSYVVARGVRVKLGCRKNGVCALMRLFKSCRFHNPPDFSRSHPSLCLRYLLARPNSAGNSTRERSLAEKFSALLIWCTSLALVVWASRVV